METEDAPQVIARLHNLRDIWDFVIDPGFLGVPYVMMLHQADLGLSSENLNVLLNIIAHKHSRGRMAFPHTKTIAKRMGTSPRSVQRALSWLIKEGFLAKVPKRTSHDRQAYNIDPLIEKLKPYAWARIQLMQEKRREMVLSDEVLVDLGRKPRKTSEEIFGDVLKQHIQNGGGYSGPTPVKHE